MEKEEEEWEEEEEQEQEEEEEEQEQEGEEEDFHLLELNILFVDGSEKKTEPELKLAIGISPNAPNQWSDVNEINRQRH